MSVYGLHFVHAHISVSGLPTCLGKKWKEKNSQWIVWGLSRAKQSKTEQKKKNSNGTRVYKTRVPLEKIEQPLGLNRSFNIFDLDN